MTTDSAPSVLLVEDEIPLSRAMSARLKLDGLDALAVYNGSDAIDALKKQQFKVVVLDLMLPDIDGFHILQKMKEMGIKTPVLVMTVLSQPEDENRAISLGAVEYLRKGDIPLVKLAEKVKGYVIK